MAQPLWPPIRAATRSSSWPPAVCRFVPIATESSGATRSRATQISIQLGPSTLVGCPPDSQADAFLAGLISAATFAVSGGTLELGLALGGRMLLSTVPEPQLVGPEWQLLSYNNGREAVVSIQAGTQPTATFSSDGRLYPAPLGCNTFNGPFQTEARSISMGPFNTTRLACPRPGDGTGDGCICRRSSERVPISS